MKKQEALNIMSALANELEKDHLCFSCAVAYVLLLTEKSYRLSDTMTDPHVCELFNRAYSEDQCVCDKESGNTRLYMNGIRTSDNGSGYWVVDCPYYSKYPSGNGKEETLRKSIKNVLELLVEEEK